MDQTQICVVPRWTILKENLDNITKSDLPDVIREFPDLVTIDVRTPPEFQAFHLDNAINIDYLSEGFLDRIEELDKNRNYLVYCRSGRRSVRTAVLMKNFGFPNIIHLEGGIGEMKV